MFKEIQQMLSAFLENPFHYVPVVTNAPIYSEWKGCRRRLTHKMFTSDIEQQVKSKTRTYFHVPLLKFGTMKYNYYGTYRNVGLKLLSNCHCRSQEPLTL